MMEESVIGVRSEGLSAKSRATRGVLGVAGVLGLLAIFLVAPEEMPFSSCVFHEITGHSCFTCGLTRSLHAVAHGDLMASLRFHLLGPLLFVCVVAASAFWILQSLTGKSILPKTRVRGTYTATVFAVVWIVYGIGRMMVEFLT
jgi:hypothetical protein